MDECEFADFGWLPCAGAIAASDWTDGIAVCVAHEGFVAGRAYETHRHAMPLGGSLVRMIDAHIRRFR